MTADPSSHASNRYDTLLIFGAPGSGKGTQGVVLGGVPRFYHCACGDVFRSLDTRTELGQEFVKYSAEGKLVPDDVTVKLWKASIDSKENSHDFKPDIDFLILDGIPRNLSQAELMEEYVNVHHVFHLSCPDREELHRRLRKRALKDNRHDDANEEVIIRRLATYEAESKPVLDFYRSKGVTVTDIDASQQPISVLQDIVGHVTANPAWQATADLVF